MNHFALPLNPSGEVSLRYGNVALERLRDRMLRLGCDAGDLRAKVFGGAAVLPFGDACDTVGAKNIAVAINWLRENSIPVIARRTGGKHGLLIRLHTDSGVVLVRKIATAPLPDSSGPVSVYDSRASPGEAIMGKPGFET
jgi:chemotaxis protein CheD